MKSRRTRPGTMRGEVRPARRWLMAAAIAATVPVVTTNSTPASAASATITVTTAAADGPGSLANAFMAASADRSVRKIVVAPELADQTITPANSFEYTGGQPLVFDGNGVTIDGVRNASVFQLRSDADVTISDVRLFQAADAIRLEPTDGTRAVRLRVIDVDINFARIGIDVADRRSGGRGVYVIAQRLTIDPAVAPVRVTVDGANASLDLRNSTIAGEVSVDQSGPGSLIARLTNVSIDSRFGGLDLAEADSGDARVSLTNVDATSSEPFSISEVGGGHLRLAATNISATAIAPFEAELRSLMALSEEGVGNLTARIRGLEVNEASVPAAAAVDASEHDAGRLDISVSRLDAGGPVALDVGIAASQTEPGVGRVRLTGNDFRGASMPSSLFNIDRLFEFNNQVLPSP